MQIMRIPDKIASAKTIHVLGITGQEGRAVFDYLLSSGLSVVGHSSADKDKFKETFISFSDAYDEEEALAMADRFMDSGKIVFGKDYGKQINKGDAVIASQAYRRHESNAPIIEMDKRGEIVLVQAIELAFSIANCKTIGVTGTAGKSTVTALIGSMLQSFKEPFYFSGNDREDKWDFFALEKVPQNGFALFEISHRHLMDLKQSPNVAVLTNIFPHHLDDAGSYDNYIEIKKNIYRFQVAGDIAIVNNSLIADGKIKENEEANGEMVAYGGGELRACFNGVSVEVPLADFKLFGEHNIQNANAAMLAGIALKIPAPIIQKSIKNFRGLKYRQELVAEHNGVKIINDGKSTDPLATIEAVKAIPKISALILGGIREGFSEGDFVPLGKIIMEQGVRRVLIFGSSKNDIAKDLSREGVNIELCVDIEDALLKAKSAAKNEEAIVFSPGCQSFDEFKDYRERGQVFNASVKKIFRE